MQVCPGGLRDQVSVFRGLCRILSCITSFSIVASECTEVPPMIESTPCAMPMKTRPRDVDAFVYASSRTNDPWGNGTIDIITSPRRWLRLCGASVAGTADVPRLLRYGGSTTSDNLAEISSSIFGCLKQIKQSSFPRVMPQASMGRKLLSTSRFFRNGLDGREYTPSHDLQSAQSLIRPARCQPMAL